MDELLKILKSNALETNEDIAKMMGVSEAEVIAKKKEYEDSGILAAEEAIDERLRVSP